MLEGGILILSALEGGTKTGVVLLGGAQLYSDVGHVLIEELILGWLLLVVV